MPVALVIFAVLIVVASCSAVIFPSEALSFASEAINGPGLWWAVAGRVVVAVLLWFSAPISHTPIAFKFFAFLSLMGAAFAAILGAEQVAQLIDWYISWPLWGVRLLFTLTFAFGVFVLWSVSRKWTAT